MAEQSTAATHALTRETSRLVELVSAFGLGEKASRRKEAARPPAAVSKPAGRAKALPASPPPKALKVAGADWSEF